MVEFMDTHEDMCSGRITETFTKEMKSYLWKLLAEKLNTMSAGGRGRTKTVKSVLKWQRVIHFLYFIKLN